MDGSFCVTAVATVRGMNLELTTGNIEEIWAFQQVIYALFALLDRYSPWLDEKRQPDKMELSLGTTTGGIFVADFPLLFQPGISAVVRTRIQ